MRRNHSRIPISVGHYAELAVPWTMLATIPLLWVPDNQFSTLIIATSRSELCSCRTPRYTSDRAVMSCHLLK